MKIDENLRERLSTVRDLESSLFVRLSELSHEMMSNGSEYWYHYIGEVQTLQDRVLEVMSERLGLEKGEEVSRVEDNLNMVRNHLINLEEKWRKEK